jgi:hypothetical protein
MRVSFRTKSGKRVSFAAGSGRKKKAKGRHGRRRTPRRNSKGRFVKG